MNFFSHESKNWTLFWIWLKELKNFHDFLTQRIEPFLNMTRKSEFFLECDSQNWTFLLTQRNEFFFSEWQRFCWIRLKESNLCLNMSHRIEPVLEFHSMDWTLCTKGLKELDPKRLFEQQNLLMTWWIGPFFSIWLKELIFFSKISLNYWPFLTSLTELNSFLEHDSQNWTFFFLRIWLIEIEPFFSSWVKKNDSIFSMTQRIFLFTYLTQRTMILSLEILTQSLIFVNKNISLRIELFFESSDN